MQAAAIAVVRTLARVYLRFAPWLAGKRWVWTRVVRPHLLWRPYAGVATTRDGALFAVTLPDVIQTTLYFFGEWDPYLSRYLRQNLRPGDVVIDVGANIGYVTLLASKLVGATGRVHAIEASSTIYGLLEQNIARNHVTNVTLHACAASDRTGRLMVYEADASNLGATTTVLSRATDAGFAADHDVPAATLPEIVGLSDLLAARVIKIDVEGAEDAVLAGVSALLDQFGPATEWFVELMPAAIEARGGTIEALVERFQNAGYSAWLVQGDEHYNAYLAPLVRDFLLPLALPLDQPTVDVFFTKRLQGADHSDARGSQIPLSRVPA